MEHNIDMQNKAIPNKNMYLCMVIPRFLPFIIDFKLRINSTKINIKGGNIIRAKAEWVKLKV